MPKLKLKTLRITATLTCESNTRIGGSKGSLETGGEDNPTIKNLRTLEPYLPGSSIKGRMRSGFEVRNGATKANRKDAAGAPCGCGKPTCMTCLLFGPHFNTTHTLGPSRLKVGDAQPKTNVGTQGGAPMLDTKMEVVMDRQTNMAAKSGLRPMEVIVPGSQFDLELRLEVWTDDKEAQMLAAVQQGLQQLEEDGIGAAFGRGYGRIKFSNVKVLEKGKPDITWSW